MRETLFRTLFLLFLLVPSAVFAQDSENNAVAPLKVIAIVLDDINERYETDLTLETEGLDWVWAEVTWTDFTRDCRTLSTPYEPISLTGYDILILAPGGRELSYRTTIEAEIVLACGSEVAGVDGVPYPVTDALADLNSRVGLSLSVNQVRWSYREVLFDDWGLGCPLDGVDYPQIDVNGLQITFDLLDQEWDYRATADRQIMFLCNPRLEAAEAAALATEEAEEVLTTEEPETAIATEEAGEN